MKYVNEEEMKTKSNNQKVLRLENRINKKLKTIKFEIYKFYNHSLTYTTNAD